MNPVIAGRLTSWQEFARIKVSAARRLLELLSKIFYVAIAVNRPCPACNHLHFPPRQSSHPNLLILM
jgi:hypothetical protein